jgi:outer membrane biosynthesis protein TonB
VRLALLVVLALLGMAAAYPFADGSRAATAGTTTTPSPDPAPTTTATPKPEPVRHYAPPPPPARTYVPPPPPPSVVQVVKPRHVAVAPTRPKHRPPRAAKKKKHVAAGSARPDLSRQQPPPATALPAVGPLTTSGAGLSGTAELILAAVFALALLLAGLALAPAEALPTPIFDLVVPRREVLVSAAGALVLGLAAGLVVLAVS